MHNGDYIIEVNRLWMDDNGIEYSTPYIFLLSDITQIEKFSGVLEWKRPPGVWVFSLSSNGGVYLDASFDEFREIWIKYQLEFSVDMLNCLKN